MKAIYKISAALLACIALIFAGTTLVQAQDSQPGPGLADDGDSADKGKGKKDPTENMSLEELYNELVMNRIIQVSIAEGTE